MHDSQTKIMFRENNQIDVVVMENNHGFCAALSESGTESRYFRSLGESLPLTEKASIAWVDYAVDDFHSEAAEAAAGAGFSDLLVRQLLETSLDRSPVQGGYEDLDSEMGLLLPAIHVQGLDVTVEPTLVLLRKNLLVTVHSQQIRFSHMRRYAEAYLGKLSRDMAPGDRLTLMLTRVLDEGIQKNAAQLQQIEDRCDALSGDLAQTKAMPVELANRIYAMKHSLIRYISGHWATVDVLSSLRYGDANLLSDDVTVLNRIGALIDQVHAQISIAEHISEVLASGLECLQSIYNNRLQILNNRLSIVNNRISLLVGWLTILGTALLVPNTIATVLSQTNVFRFTPADTGWYLALIVGSTILATSLAWWWVKAMGLMPKRGEESDAVPIPAAEKQNDD